MRQRAAQPRTLLAAHRVLGELATDDGHHADAVSHLAEALALTEACAAPYERALTLLAEARALLEPLGTRPALARADALAAAHDLS